MRIQIAKILTVLTVACIPQFILAILSILYFPSLWWVGYIVAFVVACIVHDPVSKWVEENIPR